MTPKIYVTAGGSPVSAMFYDRLIEATVRDEAGQESDSFEATFDDRNNEIALPAEGAVLEVFLGYVETGITMVGRYIVDSVRCHGDDDGEKVTITARSADVREDMKEPLSEHFENQTIGQIMDTLASRHKVQAAVSSELASIKIPYIARIDQSTLDFATRIADRFGGLFAPKGGKFVMMKCGTGKNFAGLTIAPILIQKSDCSDWDITPHPRPSYGKVTGKWLNRKTGKLEFESESTGREGPERFLRHPLPSQDEAKHMAGSDAERLNRATGSGHFTVAGRASAMAEADVIPSGFRPEINTLWRAATVEHKFSDSGFLTTVEVEAPESGGRQS